MIARRLCVCARGDELHDVGRIVVIKVFIPPSPKRSFVLKASRSEMHSARDHASALNARKDLSPGPDLCPDVVETIDL